MVKKFICAATAFLFIGVKGAWAQLPDLTNAIHNTTYTMSWKQWLVNNNEWFAPLASLIGPIIGLFLVGLFLHSGLRKISKNQEKHISQMMMNEESVQKREKAVLASSLAGELTENKIKCEAFITIYNELLRNLRDSDKKAQYEEAGDFIHQRPPLSRSIFDANVEKLSVFGSKLAGDIAQVYAAVRQDPEYFNLEADMPRPSAIRMVEMVLDDAQKTLEPMDPVIAALNVIVRGSHNSGKKA